MEIKEFKKLKGNVYELKFKSGEDIKLYDDVILKYNLLVNKSFNDKLYEEIIKYNKSLDAYYLSLKYLNSKLRCEKEIRDYLKKKDFSIDIIDKTIERLNKFNYLNRDLYIKSYISDKYNFTSNGPVKIKRELINLGFNEEEIDKYLDLDFDDKIKKIIDKKVKSNKKYNEYSLKINISNYLINLGYKKEMFNEYLNDVKIDNCLVIKKDIDKLKNKYQKKYSGKDLYYFIRNKLYQKGYREEEIGDVLNENIL